eukprot:scaffold73639_cov39-Tisochrysis_lutea.AAC.4
MVPLVTVFASAMTTNATARPYPIARTAQPATYDGRMDFRADVGTVHALAGYTKVVRGLTN